MRLEWFTYSLLHELLLADLVNDCLADDDAGGITHPAAGLLAVVQ